MKALSIRQPYAWLIAQGIKPIENRSWATKFRGNFLIHTGQQPPTSRDYLAAKEICESIGIVLPKINEFEKGGIVGYAKLIDSVTSHDSPFFFGPNGFVLKGAKPCKLISCKGQLSFFNLDLDIEDLDIVRKKYAKRSDF